MKKILAILSALVLTAGMADDIVRPSRMAAPAAEVSESRAEGKESATAAARATVSRAAANAAPEQKAQPARAARGGIPSPAPKQDVISRAAVGNNAATVAAAAPAPERATVSRAASPRGAGLARPAGNDPAAIERGAQKMDGSRSATTRTGNASLRPSVAEVGGRAIIGRTNAMTGSNVDEEAERKLGRRTRAAAENPFATKETVVETPSTSEELASCSASYSDCMNQFCNVLDQNQKQCSCSSRLAQYQKVEETLNKANEELNGVAQQIRYVGLTPDEVRSILRETEAEEILSTTEDRTESRRLLEEIEKIISSPTSASAASGGSDLNFDVSFAGDDSGFDLDSMFGGGGDNFANMRGQDLYKAANDKCKPILARCAPKKTDQSIISGQYEIEIDKACIQYEAGLKKATANVKTNVRSATQMLQKARLAVLTDQNAYDAKGCVGALDACMKDEMVCGSNYYKCIDPLKATIDENGKVISGGDVVSIKNLASEYNMMNLDDILDAAGNNCQNTEDATNGCFVIKFLENKIGKMDGNGRVMSGFCRPVLDKCRRYTYSDGMYVENNTIVKSYYERVMTEIMAAQNSIISEYASTCINDVSMCYNGQMTQVNSYAGGTTLSPSIVKPILMGACRNVTLSSAYAVFSEAGDSNPCRSSDKTVRISQEACIDRLSAMFYQAMLCPVNSTYVDGSGIEEASGNGTLYGSSGGGWVNTSCHCNSGYVVKTGTCILKENYCPANSTYDEVAATASTSPDVPINYCRCNATYTSSGGMCKLANTSSSAANPTPSPSP